MSDGLKVAAWEIKRNITNKSFLISIFMTPVIMVIFGALPTLLGMLESNRVQTVYMVDEIGIYDEVAPLINDDINLLRYDGDVDDLESIVRNEKDSSFMILDEGITDGRQINIYTAEDGFPNLGSLENALNMAMKNRRFIELGLDSETVIDITTDYRLATVSLESSEEDMYNRIVPAVFAGLILFGVFITGSMTFQSAIQEKKDKMAEVLLSSITPGALMQGKILGYFVLGIIQVFVWLAFGIPIAQYYFDIPVIRYLFVPELPIMLFFALLGYLMFSALFVSMGATIEDIQEAGNFQGMIMVIPWMPFFVIGAVAANPNGLIARVTSYFPLTSSGVMLFRLAFLSRIPVADVIISGIILIVFTWLVMKLAGKIFKTAILLYGKNATPGEILKWLKH